MTLAPARRCRGGDDDALVRVFVTIMFGAFDTTSAGITSMVYLLAKHPEWQDRVRREALAATGTLDAAGLRELEELEWVWKETLRLRTSITPHCRCLWVQVRTRALATNLRPSR